MKNVLNKVKKAVQKLKDYFPSKLPQGMTEFEAYASSIINTYNLPASDNDIRYTIAALIINGGKLSARMPKRDFVLAIRAAIAKQIAGAVFQDLQLKAKARQQAEQEAFTKAKTAEVTALHAVPSDGSK